MTKNITTGETLNRQRRQREWTKIIRLWISRRKKWQQDCDQGSISSTFYAKHSCEQIPKAQNTVHKTLAKLTSAIKFTNILSTTFCETISFCLNNKHKLKVPKSCCLTSIQGMPLLKTLTPNYLLLLTKYLKQSV